MTAEPNPSPLLHVAGTIVRDDLVFIASQVVELNEQDVDHTKVLRWKNGVWGHYMIDFATTALAHERDDALTIMALSPFGRIHVARGRDRLVEEVDDSREGPGRRGVLRDLRRIAGSTYVAGMQRQVYVRRGPGRWERCDAGAVLPLGSDAIRSFDSIDGYAANDLYAAGLEGEIWRWDGAWRQIDSPTSVRLEKVLCGPKGEVFIAGHLGTLIRGSGDQWRVVDPGDLREAIWDLAWFQGRLYAATAHGLFTLSGNDLALVVLGLGGDWSYGKLATNGNWLWSIGRCHLARTQDGTHWTEVVCTDGSY